MDPNGRKPYKTRAAAQDVSDQKARPSSSKHTDGVLLGRKGVCTRRILRTTQSALATSLRKRAAALRPRKFYRIAHRPFQLVRFRNVVVGGAWIGVGILHRQKLRFKRSDAFVGPSAGSLLFIALYNL